MLDLMVLGTLWMSLLKRNTCILHSINSEIDRTYHRLVRQNRTLDTNFVSVSEHPVAENTAFEHSVSVHSEYMIMCILLIWLSHLLLLVPVRGH
ncbi:hypothetical protein Lal_00043225 [Lupinus albus]|nr:hypothetical protein Lal_00043225 [Lupinus albus]